MSSSNLSEVVYPGKRGACLFLLTASGEIVETAHADAQRRFSIDHGGPDGTVHAKLRLVDELRTEDLLQSEDDVRGSDFGYIERTRRIRRGSLETRVFVATDVKGCCVIELVVDAAHPVVFLRGVLSGRQCFPGLAGRIVRIGAI